MRIAILLLAARAFADTAPPAAVDKARADDVSRVYVAAIGHELRDVDSLVIAEPARPVPKLTAAAVKGMPHGISDGTVADFLRQPEQPIGRLLLVRRMTFVPRADIDALFKAGWWKEFHQKYGDAQGFLQLSPVGFNATRTEAVVALDWSCGSLCGFGQLIHLVKIKGSWTVKQSQMRWIS